MQPKNDVDNDFDVEHHNERELQTRIVGGVSVDPQRYPYFAFLSVVTNKGYFRCGGTLVAPTVIMSAAHCYQDFIEDGYQILGIKAWVNISSTTIRTGYEYGRRASKIVLNPAYERRGTKNDVMLLQFDEPIRGIEVPFIASSTTSLVEGDPVTVLGYGLLSESGTLATDLHGVDINIISYDDCNDSNSYNGLVIPSIMVCAGAIGGGKDTCLGDSGGPLIVKGDGTPGDDVVVGLVSWGAGCARAEKYGVYSKISAFADFIKKNLCSLSSDPPEYCFQSSPTASSPVELQRPTDPPSSSPTVGTSSKPSFRTTIFPSGNPSTVPTNRPTNVPTPSHPSTGPTNFPSIYPSIGPTINRSISPSLQATSSLNPSDLRSDTPTDNSSTLPFLVSSNSPSASTSGASSAPSSTLSAEPSVCTDWGSPCSVHTDCCSMNCLETNNVLLGKRCFGPEKGSAPRGGSMGSIRRIGNGRGGAGSGAGV